MAYANICQVAEALRDVLWQYVCTLVQIELFQGIRRSAEKALRIWLIYFLVLGSCNWSLE